MKVSQVLSQGQKDAIIDNLMNGGQAKTAGAEPQYSTAAQRQLAQQTYLKKEAMLAQALQTEAGLKKIAANMANPVRQRLDYRGIFRKFAVVEQMPIGIPLIYDKDQPDVPAVKLGRSGTPGIVEMKGKRVQLKAFEIAARPKVPYSELYVRRYRALDRCKDRLISGMELREDLNGFQLIATAQATAVNPTVDLGAGTYLTKDGLARGFALVERWRLPVSAVLISPAGVRGIRGWTFQYLDQIGMQAIRESGYLGTLWQANFFVSDQILTSEAWILTSPKFLAWMPIYKDLDVIPADDPDNLRLGFIGYELLGMTVHNALGVARVIFDATV